MIRCRKMLMIVFSFVVLPRCITSGKQFDLALLPDSQTMFRDCRRKDGSVYVKAYRDGQFLGGGEVDWRSGADSRLNAEFGSSFGITDLTVDLSQEQALVSGRYASRLPGMGLTQDGIITLSGNPIGLTTSEVSCLLAFSLPITWGQLATTESAKELAVRLPGRHVSIRLPSGVAEPVCATVSWRKWFIIPQQLDWCTTGYNSTELHLANGYKLEWTASNDESRS